MGKIIRNSWALFTGYIIIMISHGFQGNLLGIRAVLENFNFIATGTMMSGYFAGFFVGAYIIPNLVSKVGHIRVFAALASLASIAILLHSIFINPIVWSFIRILTGVSIAGIFVIMESWLNDKSTNQTRGQLLGIYMIVTFVFVGLGQLLLNLSDPSKVDLFILVSILLSLC